jgi:hypothetical protein
MDREPETEIDRELHRLGELSRRFTVNVQDLVGYNPLRIP